jgi:hypothetical protein
MYDRLTTRNLAVLLYLRRSHVDHRGKSVKRVVGRFVGSGSGVEVLSRTLYIYSGVAGGRRTRDFDLDGESLQCTMHG